MVATSIDREQLKSAFDVFNHQSGLLEQSYRELQAQVEALTRQLGSEQAARVRQLEKTERLSRRLSELLESLPGGILVIDTGGAVLQHNREAAALLGEPLMGRPWSSIVADAVRGDASADGNLKLRDGRWLSLSRRRLSDGAGEIILLANVTDSLQLASLRERRERLTAIGEMTAEFAHQVRTPLASAMLYAAQLDTTTPSQARVVSKISERLSDLGRMVDDMLVYARGSTSAGARVAVADIIDSALAALDGQLPSATRVEIDDRCPGLTIEANADALRGALVNLLSNAAQAGAGTIAVSAELFDDTLELKVSDDGPGIDAALLPRVFDAFFTTRPQGTGLGLAVVKSVATAHGGSADVASSGDGTRFTIRLPVSP